MAVKIVIRRAYFHGFMMPMINITARRLINGSSNYTAMPSVGVYEVTRIL